MVKANAMNTEIKHLAFGIVVLIFLASIAAYCNVTSNTTTTVQPIRVACVGDSITQRSGYPFKLHQMLGPNYTVGNFGVSGATVSCDSILPYMNQSEFQKAKDFGPDIIIIMLGTNDANPQISPNETNFTTDYNQLISDFEQLQGRQLVWILKSPPIVTNNSSYNNTILANTVIPQIDDLANNLNLPTVDMYGVFINHTDAYLDGVHPNNDGATLIASTVYDAITLPDGSPDTSPFNDGNSG